ncbi:MAG TPA: serine hydrolase domain-containing protein [Candidatus Limnocylindrales bacterium]
MHPSEIEALLQDLADADAFSGVVRVTAHGEERFAGAYGLASRAWGVPNTLEMRFDTASITKLFTAVAALQQVDAAAFALDEPVTAYLGLAGTQIAPEVTLRHLLTHTSGIGDDADEEAGEPYEDVYREHPNYAIRETADFLPQFVHRAPNFPPGRGCRYNNCGYVLAGLMIERATGRSYRDVVQHDVFERAGMIGATFQGMDTVRERVAEGADPVRDAAGSIVGWRRNIYSFPPSGSPDSGALVTAVDLDRFIDAVRKGRLLSPASTDAFLTPQVDYRERDGWWQRFGLGPWFRVEPDGEALFLEKEGTNPGVSGFVRHYPAWNITAVVLSNIGDGAWEPGRRLHDAVMAGEFS